MGNILQNRTVDDSYENLNNEDKLYMNMNNWISVDQNYQKNNY